MRLTVMGYGTRGDVQPALCLAWGLMVRGHCVRLVAPRNMEPWIARSGVPFVPLPVDTHANRVDMRRVLIEATEDAEAIVTHPLLEDRAAAIGSARQIPVMPWYPFPLVPSAHFPHPAFTTRNMGPLNRLTHDLLNRQLWNSCRDDVNELRALLRVTKAKRPFVCQRQRSHAPCILAYSPSIFPSPRDYGIDDIVTGTIAPPVPLRVLLGEVGIPAPLEAWLRAGDPPIFLGFGSMPVLDVDRMLELAREALALLGKRAVISAGWSEVPDICDRTLFAVKEVDHSALLPRCAAAVHHGGSGTTYESLRAGCPTLVCSVFADQPFWGARVRELGVGDTLSFSKLTAERLAERIAAVSKPEVRERGQRLAKRLSREDGLTRAVSVVERKLSNAPVPL